MSVVATLTATTDVGSCSTAGGGAGVLSSEFYSAGDIPSCLVSKICGTGLQSFCGAWELMPSRSESPDELMKALGFGMLKRNVMRNYKTQLEVSVLEGPCNPDADLTKTKIMMVSRLPMGIKKDVTVQLDGSPVSLFDSDTNVTWTNVVAWVDGNRLCQKRTSSLGAMYDVRCVFTCDPEGQCSESPIMLFRWTFVDLKGKVCAANRWFRKLPAK